jgi:hypothetical protein
VTLPDRVFRACGQRPVSLEPVVGGGYSLALRLRATFDDGSTAFVKVATSERTAGFLREEKHVYTFLGRQPFLAAYHGFDEPESAEEFPLLVLEDLGEGFSAPPWTHKQIDAVLVALAQIRQAPVPPDLPALETHRESLTCWQSVADSPAPFLSLGLCDASWLTNSLPSLLAAEKELDLAGESLLHMDVRSDNIAFRPDGGAAVFVDWNWACVGNPQMDLAAWLPSLASEGGPLPEALLPDGGGGPWAAGLAGYFAASAGLPPPEGAPRVREVQRTQLEAALPWAIRALGLPAIK